MGEPACPFILRKASLCHGHYGELAVIVDPWGRLVSLFQSPYMSRIVGVHPSVSVFSSLGRPEILSPGQSHGRVGISGRHLVGGLGADKSVDIVNRLEISAGVLFAGKTESGSEENGADKADGFHIMSFGDKAKIRILSDT